MVMFSKRFYSLLEADNIPATDKEAMQAELDKGSTPEDFGAKELPANPDRDNVRQAKQANMSVQLNQLKTWVEEIDKFTTYLNGVNSESIQTQLHQAGCDSLFEKIARSETKKIARVAVDLSSLSESFKGYLIAGSAEARLG